jgi:predicted RNase H-like HicB family nuclease
MREVFMKYKVNLKKTEEGYSVWVPGLPGCWSQGHTEEEALENIKDAIKAYLETVDDLSKSKSLRDYCEVAQQSACVCGPTNILFSVPSEPLW